MKMATKKVNTYIEAELDWLTQRAEELKSYCDANPPHKIKDRMVGGKVISKIEEQIKCTRETYQDYLKIIEAIDKLREKENAKGPSVRGDQELSPLEKGEI